MARRKGGRGTRRERRRGGGVGQGEETSGRREIERGVGELAGYCGEDGKIVLRLAQGSECLDMKRGV